MRMWTLLTQRRRSCGWQPSLRRCLLTLSRRGNGGDHRSRTLSCRTQVSPHDETVLVHPTWLCRPEDSKMPLSVSDSQLSP